MRLTLFRLQTTMSRTDINVVDITEDNAHDVLFCRQCLAVDVCPTENFICCTHLMRYLVKMAKANRKTYRLHGDNITIEIRSDAE